jgi:hypothetical protein
VRPGVSAARNGHAGSRIISVPIITVQVCLGATVYPPRVRQLVSIF